MEKLLKFENDWDGEVDCPEVMGPRCLISEEEVSEAIKGLKMGKAAGTKRIQPASGWCDTVGATVQIVSTYPGVPATQFFFGKPAVRPRSMAGGAPTPCGRH